MLNLLIIIN